MCQAHVVHLAFQATKGNLESRDKHLQVPQVKMGILVIRGTLGTLAHLDPLRTEVCVLMCFSNLYFIL